MTSTATETEPAPGPAPRLSLRHRVWAGFGGVAGGFRTFILRGNIVDLAVGVVIGVAFNSLVTGFTNDFIQPLIKLVSGGKELAGTFTVRHQTFQYAAFINAIINFLLVAAALYVIVVLPMNKLNERRARLRGNNAPTAVPDDIALLTEIRDALVEANRRAAPVPAQTTAAEAEATPPVAAPRRRTRPAGQPPVQ